MITHIDPIIYKPGYIFNESNFTTPQEASLASSNSGISVSGASVADLVEDTQQISYDSVSNSTNIIKLTAGNFNTSLLESINENVQTNIDNLKQKTQGITNNNNVTTISNVNATTLTAGNINTSHLSGTTSNLNTQITNISNAIVGVTYLGSNDTTTLENNVHITGTITAPGLNITSVFSQTLLYSTALDNFQVIIPAWARSIDIVCQGAGGSGGSSPATEIIFLGAFERYHLSGGGGSAGGFSKATMYRFPGQSSVLSLFNAVGAEGVTTFTNGLAPIRDTYVTYGINNYTVCWAQRGRGGIRGKENVLEGEDSVASVSGGWGNVSHGGNGAEGTRWNNNAGRRGFSATPANDLNITIEGSSGGSSGGGLTSKDGEYIVGPGISGGGIWMTNNIQPGPPIGNPISATSSSLDYGFYGVGFAGPASSPGDSFTGATLNTSTTGNGFGGSGGSSCGCTTNNSYRRSGRGGDGYIILTFNA